MWKTNILKGSCPKQENNIFFTFLDKMQFSAILCLATFCADESHLVKFAK